MSTETANGETADGTLIALEHLVVRSVGVTARAVAAEAPDLTLQQWRVIVVLAPAADGMAVSELAGHLGSRLPATSRLLARLRDRGLVHTRKGVTDGRVTLARLAPDGRTMWERVRDRRRRDLLVALAAADLAPGDASIVERLADGLLAFA